MELDFIQYLRRLEAETCASDDFAGSMARLMAWANRQQPHADWVELARLDAQAEIDAGRAWLRHALPGRPQSLKTRGAWFGLMHADEHGTAFADLRVRLLGHCNPQDPSGEWRHTQPAWQPDGGGLESSALQRAGLICHRAGRAGAAPLGTHGNKVYGTAFATLLLRHILDGEVYRLLGGTAPIGIGTGFDPGEFILIGELASRGFVANPHAFA